jgi:molybdopterin converting factor small subunit
MRVLFFGKLAEIAGGRERQAPPGLATLDAVVTWACEGDAALREALGAKGVRIAVNQAIVHEAMVALGGNDEIAFMPPLSGG